MSSRVRCLTSHCVMKGSMKLDADIRKSSALKVSVGISTTIRIVCAIAEENLTVWFGAGRRYRALDDGLGSQETLLHLSDYGRTL